MAVTEHKAYRFEWKPRVDALRDALLIDDEDVPAFLAVLDRAKAAYAPRAWVRELTIEAVGDDFAMVSGVWLDGAYPAALFSGTERAWVYAATAGEAPAPIDTDGELSAWWIRMLGEEALRDTVGLLAAEMPCGQGERIGNAAPGTVEAWPAEQRQQLLGLLDGTEAGVAQASEVGILYAGAGGCGCGGCGSGHCGKQNCSTKCARHMQ